jgi:hypothetical protein
MEIEKQKKIKYIPLVNFFITVRCMNKAFDEKGVSGGRRTKVYSKMGIIALILTLPRIAINYLFHNEALDIICMWIFSLVIIFLISCVAIDEQEKLNENHK